MVQADQSAVSPILQGNGNIRRASRLAETGRVFGPGPWKEIPASRNAATTSPGRVPGRQRLRFFSWPGRKPWHSSTPGSGIQTSECLGLVAGWPAMRRRPPQVFVEIVGAAVVKCLRL